MTVVPTRRAHERIALTADEAADMCGVSKRTITDAHDRGDLVGHWLGTKRLYSPDELRAWVEALPTERAKKAS